MFNKQNLFICTYEQEVIGMILWIKGKVEWDPIKFFDMAKQCGVELDLEDLCYLNKEYFETYGTDVEKKECISLLNVCIKSKYRKRKVGTLMLKEFILRYPNSDIELTVLKNSVYAMKIYNKMGFKIIKEYTSKLFSSGHLNCSMFHGEEPACYMMKRTGMKVTC